MLGSESTRKVEGQSQSRHGVVVRSGGRMMTYFFAFLAIPFLIAAIVNPNARAEFALLCLGCLAAAAAAFPWKKGGREFRCTDQGLVIDSHRILPWDQLLGCYIGNQAIDPTLAMNSNKKGITLQFQQALVKLRCDPPSTDSQCYQSIVQLQQLAHLPQLNDAMLKLWDRETAKHGPQTVTAAGVVKKPANHLIIRGRHVLAFAVLFGFAFAAATTAQATGFSAGIASVTGIVGTGLAVLYLIEKVRRVSQKKPQGGIIISPDRLALHIDNLKGEMKWDELRELKLTPSLHKPQKLTLRLAGVDIPLTDRFQLPLWLLHQQCETMRASYRKASSPIAGPVATPANVQDSNPNPYQPPQNF